MRLTKLSPRLLVFMLLAACSWGPHLQAEVRLPNVFGSHMVFQQEKPLTICGWAEPGETIRVELPGQSADAKANERGEWKAVLHPMAAGGPFVLKITGSSSVHYEDVMVGEVWLCSGQSNMEMGIGRVQNAKAEIAAADHPGIRLLKVTKRWTPQPQTNFEGAWKVCSPTTVAEGGWDGFSAAAYFFGRDLNQQLGVTVGLIDATWGGTRIEPWTPPEGFAAVPALREEYEKVQLAAPGTDLHRERLEQTLKETELWVDSARKSLSDNTLVTPIPTYPS